MAEPNKIIMLDEGWSTINQGITKLINILEKIPGESQFDSNKIHERYEETFENYLRSRFLPAIHEKHGVFMMREFVERWSRHNVMVRWLSRFFYYLDRYYIARGSLPKLEDTGINCFHIIVHESLKVQVTNVVITLINRERDGDEIDRTMLKNALENFDGGLDCYVDDFETAFLNDTADYCSRKASLWIQEDSCPEYMIKAEELLKREKHSVSNYLHSSTEEKLLEKVQHHLLLDNAQLFEKEHSGCHGDDKTEDLERMYRLFYNIRNGLDPISTAFKQHVTSEVTTKNKDKVAVAMQEQAFVRRVIELHGKYYAYVYVTISFKKDNLFHKALKEAFEVFCNKKVGDSLVAELLSTFSDGILGKVGAMRNWVMMPLRKPLTRLYACFLLDDKDLFAGFCKKKLARRLLFDKNSTDDDHERSFLSKLKQQYGAQFTSKMEGMINDLEIASDTQNIYKVDYTNKYDYTSNDIDFNVTIKKNRKLTFLYSMGSCNGTGKFQKKPIELIVSTHQAVVLKDSFSLNVEFTDKMRRIKIPLPPVDEKKNVIEDVDKDRRYTIDASIVRIMKARKVLQYNNLVTACVEQLSRMFKPYFKSIKKRNTDLISREFLEREEGSPNTVGYLA
ncbi:hypothetical protein MKW98_026030 [Papaver atlanticum]|uniref:Cullin family profile domain-containing protein n=1 Tax=Papaver atlanticum TaxID=357466 RepID=A0AAD4RYC1_9MAGN|nr:hypothetical protein MKW98_026030 [Papaver atlanticum]